MTKEYNNIYEMLENTVLKYGAKSAFFEKNENNWTEITWSEYKVFVDHFAMALMDQGLQKGDAVSILAGNCFLWPVADVAAIAAGGIGVGLYPSSSPEQCEYILNHSQSKFIVVDTEIQLNKILEIRKKLNYLKGIIVHDSIKVEGENIIAWSDFLKFGENFKKNNWEIYQKTAHAATYEDTAVIVYTSGTTGNPKGACLSHRYILASCKSLEHLSQQACKALSSEKIKKLESEQLTSLSFLPHCHAAERICGMYVRIYSGQCAYFVDNIAKLYEYVLEIGPHNFGGLPRLYEKLYAKIMNEVEIGKEYNKEEFYRAIEITKKIKEYRKKSQAIPDELQKEFEVHKHIYEKVRSNFGKRILTCSSGAAPIPKEVLEMFEYAGDLTILEAYGLTEFICCAFNTPLEHKANSVGKPMLGCEIKIAKDGEILLKGPQMFSGYYKNEKATKEVIDGDGWLHTGDIGKIDEDGFLFITGRKKEFIKTSTGKKIAPLYIENICKRNHLISNVMVYGDNKKYITALITLNPLELMSYAKINKIEYTEYKELVMHDRVKRLMDEVITEVNSQVSSTEQIKKYTILQKDFSVEANEITPTGKVKRKKVSEIYMDIIEAMYG